MEVRRGLRAGNDWLRCGSWQHLAIFLCCGRERRRRFPADLRGLRTVARLAVDAGGTEHRASRPE